MPIILLRFSDDRHAPPIKKSKNDDEEEEDLNDANYDEVWSIIRKKGYRYLFVFLRKVEIPGQFWTVFLKINIINACPVIRLCGRLGFDWF